MMTLFIMMMIIIICSTQWFSVQIVPLMRPGTALRSQLCFCFAVKSYFLRRVSLKSQVTEIATLALARCVFVV